MLTPIRTCRPVTRGPLTYLVAVTMDGRRLRHVSTDWDDAAHPQQIANVITIRGRIHEDYWVPFTPAAGASEEDRAATLAEEAR
jgi:hypothetical protein